jgi:hypothetical protein
VIAGLILGTLLGLGPSLTAHAGCPKFVEASQGLPTQGEWRTHPALADVNGDGRLDLAGNPRKGSKPGVWLGTPEGDWTPTLLGLAIPGFTCGIGVDFADVNGDRHPDLGVADHCQGIFVFLGDGGRSWRLGPTVPLKKRRGYNDLEFGDLNGDGHDDLVAVSASQDGIAAFLGDGKGGWTKHDAGLPPGGYGTDVKLVDLNGDGTEDVVAAFVHDDNRFPRPERRLEVVWLSDGSGAYHPASGGLPDDGSYWGVAVADVNGDKRLDLALSADIWPGLPPLHVYVADGEGGWTPAMKGLPPADAGLVYEGIELADMDRDGHTDLIAINHRGAGIELWSGDGKGGWERCTETGLPGGRPKLRGWGVAVGDVNVDGKNDIAAGFGRNGSGSLEVWVQK